MFSFWPIRRSTSKDRSLKSNVWACSSEKFFPLTARAHRKPGNSKANIAPQRKKMHISERTGTQIYVWKNGNIDLWKDVKTDLKKSLTDSLPFWHWESTTGPVWNRTAVQTNRIQRFGPDRHNQSSQVLKWLISQILCICVVHALATLCRKYSTEVWMSCKNGQNLILGNK